MPGLLKRFTKTGSMFSTRKECLAHGRYHTIWIWETLSGCGMLTILHQKCLLIGHTNWARERTKKTLLLQVSLQLETSWQCWHCWRSCCCWYPCCWLSWSRIHAHSVSLRFLVVILKVLRLEVSIWRGYGFLSGFPPSPLQFTGTELEKS